MLDEIKLFGELGLRPASAEDHAFFEQLFRSTRQHLYQIDMPVSSIDNLVNQQYQLQQISYAHQTPDAFHLVILLSKKPVGKIILDRTESFFLIVDLALLPEHRGLGIGTAVLRAIQTAAKKNRRSITLSVDQQNPGAKKLYLSLGFQVDNSSDTHDEMIWTP